MKKLDRQFFQSVLVVLLSLAIVLIILACYVKIDEYKKLSYKVDTKFVNNDVVLLSNKLPISDEIGKNYNGSGMEKSVEGYTAFSITNPNERKVEYEIYLTKINQEVDEINPNYIKLYLTDDKNVPMKGFEKNKVLSYYDLYSLTDRPGSRLLYRGTLVSGGKANFILRSWVADTYILSKYTQNFSFDIDVRLK